jgi:Na+/H+-dicarboxylate symporter
MLFAPIGVFCLLAKVTAEHGVGAIQSQLKYFFCVLGVLLLQFFVVFGGIVKLLAKKGVWSFFHRVREVILVAFSTSSSNATLPLTMTVAKDKLGLDPKISSFVIPLGATINMNGTAIMQGVAVVFVAGVYGVDLSIWDYLVVVGMATLAAVGTAGVPSVGLITLAMVFEQVQIPVEGIALILAVDRLLDMVRTVVNVLGDLVVATVIDRWAQGK